MNLNPTNGASKPLVPSSKLYLLIFMKGPYSLEASNNFSGIKKKAPNISIQKEKEDNPEQTVLSFSKFQSQFYFICLKIY